MGRLPCYGTNDRFADFGLRRVVDREWIDLAALRDYEQRGSRGFVKLAKGIEVELICQAGGPNRGIATELLVKR